MQCPWRFPATLPSTNRVRLSGVSGGSGVPPPQPSVIRLASELCSSLDRDGLRMSPPPEPEPLALLGTGTRPGPVAEGQEGGSSLSGLQRRGVKVCPHSAESLRSTSCHDAPDLHPNIEQSNDQSLTFPIIDYCLHLFFVTLDLRLCIDQRIIE